MCAIHWLHDLKFSAEYLAASIACKMVGTYEQQNEDEDTESMWLDSQLFAAGLRDPPAEDAAVRVPCVSVWAGLGAGALGTVPSLPRPPSLASNRLCHFASMPPPPPLSPPPLFWTHVYAHTSACLSTHCISVHIALRVLGVGHPLPPWPPGQRQGHLPCSVWTQHRAVKLGQSGGSAGTTY